MRVGKVSALKGVANSWRLLSIFVILFPVFYTPVVAALDANDLQDILHETPFYDPTDNGTAGGATGSCSTDGSAGTTTVTFNNQAAEAVAKAASATNVGYALYDSTGNAIAEYNDTFENYGASITKAMILVAYLNQLGTGTLSADATADLTGMIENSDDPLANKSYDLLNNPATEINAVAKQAGMAGFKYDDQGDSLYYLGQSQITAQDFAKFFSIIDTLFPASQKTFALNLLSNISGPTGLLQSGLPGTVYSKEGWKPEPGGGTDPARTAGANVNPFGVEGTPYIVNQAAQFSAGGTTYGLAVTVGGTTDRAAGEAIIKQVATALIQVQTTGLVGSDNETQIWNYFKSQGLSDPVVAGIMGNIQRESSFDPEKIVGGGDSQNPADSGAGAWGLVQWQPGSKVIAEAAKYNITGPIYELSTQLAIIMDDLTITSPTGAQDMLAGMQTITDPAAAATYFNKYFEVGTDPGNVRENDAIAIMAKYGNPADTNPANPTPTPTTPTTPTPVTTGCQSAAIPPNCQSAAGVARILCDAEQYDPVSYQLGGGHQGGAAWHASCPVIGPSCYLDCSGLVNIAVYDVYGTELGEDTFSEVTDTTNWKQVQFSQLQPGDIVQPYQPDTPGNHVEIVDHVTGNTIYTFGAHTANAPQPDQVGATSMTATISPTFPATATTGDVYLQYIGPGQGST